MSALTIRFRSAVDKMAAHWKAALSVCAFFSALGYAMLANSDFWPSRIAFLIAALSLACLLFPLSRKIARGRWRIWAQLASVLIAIAFWRATWYWTLVKEAAKTQTPVAIPGIFYWPSA